MSARGSKVSRPGRGKRRKAYYDPGADPQPPRDPRRRLGLGDATPTRRRHPEYTPDVKNPIARRRLERAQEKRARKAARAAARPRITPEG